MSFITIKNHFNCFKYIFSVFSTQLIIYFCTNIPQSNVIYIEKKLLFILLHGLCSTIICKKNDLKSFFGNILR
jgi:hypothetical protein